MDFERYKEINDRRLHYGEMEDASVVSSYRNTGCGDGYRLYLKIEDDRIVDASYTTTGCGFGLTALAMATEWVKGRTLDEAEAMTGQDIESLFEFPPRRKNYPESAVQAMQKAVADYRSGTGIRPEDRVSAKHALALLREQGHLRGAKLNQVVLENEDLSTVDFSGADLSHAYLIKCNLKNASFAGARLRGTFLNQANLEGADFRNADLRWAKLSGANLEGAQFAGAQYDIGTRVDARYTQIFSTMVQAGKEAYVEKDSAVQTA
ncbi:MAG: pentapeptide repeat-containing protein [Spirochaetales bacterium]|nr:pentapeptide repeat-containing protein [Spirochaetales bacterium]